MPKGKPKTPKVPGFYRHIFAENLGLLIEHHYPSSKVTPAIRDIYKATGIAIASIQRYLKADTGQI